MERSGAGPVTCKSDSRQGAIIVTVPASTAPASTTPASTAPAPCSPRLAHLRPPTPLTPEAMHRIRLLTVQEQPCHAVTDPSKLSPISPSTSLFSPTSSDLGSSPRSSISVTTSSSSSFTWSAYREGKKSSSDFTDVDSDLSKDLFSPSITLSPAPFSPFSDQPAAAFAETASTAMRQRLHFSFDPKSPTLPTTPAKSFLPAPSSYGYQRGRSWSEGATAAAAELSGESSTSLTPTMESEEKTEAEETSGPSAEFVVPASVDEQGNVYKKRLARKRDEEGASSMESGPALGGASADVDTGSDEKPSAPKSSRPNPDLRWLKSITLPLVQSPPSFSPATRSLSRCTSSLPDYGRGYRLWSSTAASSSSAETQQSSSLTAPLESLRLPLFRLEETSLANTQADFNTWLNRQLFAVNPLWYPPPGSAPVPGYAGQRGISSFRSFLSSFPTSPVATANPFVLPPSLPPPPQALPPPPPPPPPPQPHQPVGSIYRPSPIYPPSVYPPMRYLPVLKPPVPPTPSMAFSRRSRSESDASYDCQHCGQSFNMRDRLAKHVACRHREHGGSGSTSEASAAKNYKCTVCQKYFGRSDMLTRHMRLHTGIRPYVCHTCGQVFSRSDHLSTHLRTHTGEKPYQCPVCPYAASRRDMITRHMRTHSRLADTSSGEACTSGTSHVEAIEEALDQTALGEPSTSEGSRAFSSEHWRQLSTESKISPSSDSDHQSGSTGSTSTLLCLEEEVSGQETTDEKDQS